MMGAIKALIHKTYTTSVDKPLQAKDLDIVTSVHQKKYAEYYCRQKSQKKMLLGMGLYQSQKYIFEFDCKSQTIHLLHNQYKHIADNFFAGTVLVLDEAKHLLDCKMINGKICRNEHIMVRKYICEYVSHLYTEFKYIEILPIQDIYKLREYDGYDIIPAFAERQASYFTYKHSHSFQKLLEIFQEPQKKYSDN